jgi:hypothetical protein
MSPKRPKKDVAPGKTGKTRKPKPKKKTARGKLQPRLVRPGDAVSARRPILERL